MTNACSNTPMVSTLGFAGESSDRKVDMYFQEIFGAVLGRMIASLAESIKIMGWDKVIHMY